MILEIDGVELYFSNKRILNGIYLKAETGKVTGILGRNGCGKSCLINIIFGSLQPKYKCIRMDGRPILKPFYRTQNVCLLPQHSHVPKDLKIKTIFKLLKVDWLEFTSVFQSLSFSKETRFLTLSGGERRVVETYLVLKSDKKIVLLDEPFSHIAPLYIEQFKQLIELEKKDESHYLN
jgi:ABC-type multidrug transport system ATPase subunit